MTAALVVLALALVAASGSAVALALRSGSLVAALKEATLRDEEARRALAELTESSEDSRLRLSELVAGRDRELESLHAAIEDALSGCRDPDQLGSFALSGIRSLLQKTKADAGNGS